MDSRSTSRCAVPEPAPCARSTWCRSSASMRFSSACSCWGWPSGLACSSCTTAKCVSGEADGDRRPAIALPAQSLTRDERARAALDNGGTSATGPLRSVWEGPGTVS
eukprot:scaffold124105_cov66-Phaeocystis_antarctica.AAC.2